MNDHDVASRKTLVLAVAVAVGAVGCGGSSGTCEGSLGEVGAGCPATFSGTLDVSLCGLYGSLDAHSCGDLIVLAKSGGYTAGFCAYDAATHGLVGARQSSDVNSYCGSSSFTKTAGRFPNQSCLASAPTSTFDCRTPQEDGGAADGVSE